ncbi:unnamed protein product [Staurois parvus]|uniref:Uncharacterized protein n=1 Tax=Staurois parvus TaxID=386267 RepID=A0ABN9CMW0_9NEOB|nr:unnamed protein product [Staurois parvus]
MSTMLHILTTSRLAQVYKQLRAVQGRVAIYKHSPASQPVHAPKERVAPLTGAHCTDHCTRPLCEVPIM